ncbi:MAG: FHA domain-containing protein [Planctomycetota bacterium]|nr:FHA domain-containing protein [Planctomycetota bacterium]
MNQTPARRFLLWIDGVGGYLACLSDSVTLGQPGGPVAPSDRLGNVAGSAATVDVPILGDLSHRHATISRSGEGYTIQPLRAVQINDRPIEQTTMLHDGDNIRLGNSVVYRFRVPHPLSQTARLDPISYHRTQPTTKGILLMAESCILGPASNSQVICPRWTGEVVLFRQPPGSAAPLGCRTSQPYSIDGKVAASRAAVQFNSQISGSDFAFGLESLP